MNKSTSIKFIVTLALILNVLFNKAQQQEGLTVYSLINPTLASLMDTNGVVTHTWSGMPGGTRYSQYLMAGGTLVRTAGGTGFSITPTHGGMYTRLQKIDWNNNIIWDWTLNTPSVCLNHDFAIMPNGHILATVAVKKTGAEYQAAGGTNTTITGWLSQSVIEIEPVGTNSANIVWQWNLWDHWVQNTNSLVANYQPSIVTHPELMNINYNVQADLMHMNGFDYNPVLDQIAMSSRYKDEIYIIDHSTTTAEAATHFGGNSGKGGDILYRWGNPAAYQAVGPKILDAPHDSHWMPEGCPDAGFLVVLNISGVTTPSARTCVDKVLTPRTGYTYSITPGAAFTPSQATGRYMSPVQIGGYSNSVQFKNGNQQMCFTTGTIWEVNSMGTTIFTKTLTSFSPQSHRYPSCYVLNPPSPQPSITVNGASLTTVAAFDYQWYKNGDAVPTATNQSYVPNQTGIYLVRVTDLMGCVFLYSSGMLFTPPPPPPIPTTLPETISYHMKNLKLYPNPSTGEINIGLTGVEDYAIEVYSINGQLLLTEKNSKSVNLNNFENGLYLVKISSEGISTTKRITLLK